MGIKRGNYDRENPDPESREFHIMSQFFPELKKILQFLQIYSFLKKDTFFQKMIYYKSVDVYTRSEQGYIHFYKLALVHWMSVHCIARLVKG